MSGKIPEFRAGLLDGLWTVAIADQHGWTRAGDGEPLADALVSGWTPLAPVTRRPEEGGPDGERTGPHAGEHWAAVWDVYNEAYTRYQNENNNWRAYYTDHHRYALDCALRAFDRLREGRMYLGLCDGCGRDDRLVVASDDGRAVFCRVCLPLANKAIRAMLDEARAEGGS